jgi:hypothetical protein
MTTSVDANTSLVFGNLAVLAARKRRRRPMALRPRLSPGLPLSNDQLLKNLSFNPQRPEMRAGRWTPDLAKTTKTKKKQARVTTQACQKA